jgi:regulator of cell morphogenesis and NO signaling
MPTMTEVTDRTVGELAAEVPTSIRIFEAWKIDYCCGGLTPLSDACAAAGKSVDQFIAELEKAAVVPDASARDWRGDTLKTMASKIVKMYHDYTREELATLIPLATKVQGVHGERRPELEDVKELVQALAGDMLPHMLKEEQILFPYVGQLEAGDAPTPFFGTVKNPVRMMMLEHDRVGELLATLREVTGDYEIPDGACFSYRELYRRLAEFEARTHEHIHIENNLFFPRAVALEEKSGNATTFAAPEGAGGCGAGCNH